MLQDKAEEPKSEATQLLTFEGVGISLYNKADANLIKSNRGEAGAGAIKRFAGSSSYI